MSPDPRISLANVMPRGVNIAFCCDNRAFPPARAGTDYLGCFGRCLARRRARNPAPCAMAGGGMLGLLPFVARPEESRAGASVTPRQGSRAGRRDWPRLG
jgi:hypothetical protein